MVPRKEGFDMEGFDNLKVVAVGFPEKCCDHGRCLDHSPDWYRLGDGILQPQVAQFDLMDHIITLLRHLPWPVGAYCPEVKKIKIFSEKCCSKPLIHCALEVDLLCKKCNRKDIERTKNFKCCTCCGYKKSFVPGDIFGLGPTIYIDIDELALINARLNNK
jgi:hypothetical protein